MTNIWPKICHCHCGAKRTKGKEWRYEQSRPTTDITSPRGLDSGRNKGGNDYRDMEMIREWEIEVL